MASKAPTASSRAASAAAPKPRGSAAKTFAETLKLARMGTREAQYEVGLMYANGVGTQQSLEKAIEWLSQAAQRGLPAAQYLLATRYAHGIAVGQDQAMALWWCMKAAQQGHLKAHYKLGQWLDRAHPQASVASLRVAAEQGLPEAQYALYGKLFDQATGPTDLQHALDWLQRAAAQGLAAAQCRLAEHHAQGLGLAADLEQAFVWYRKAARQNHAKAQLALEHLADQGGRKSRGRRKASSAERRQAADRWIRVADGADAEGKYCIGQMYAQALGVDHDPAVARSMFLGAARQGYVPAQVALAQLLADSEPQEALAWYDRAAKAGEPRALHVLAQAQLQSTEPQARAQALASELQAALAGHAEAQAAIAQLLQAGQPDLGLHFLQQAAQGGVAEAQYRLGLRLAEGSGPSHDREKDREQAVQCWQKAAQAGHVAAASALGAALLGGQGTPRNAAAAVPWLQQAAQAGDAKAQWNLGGLFVSGSGGLAHDMAQALAWCHKAAEQGFVPAQATLGLLYERLGQPQQALHYLEQAARAGDAEARYNLACLYRAGRGLPKDLEQAFAWLCLAAEQGVLSAQSKLGVAYGAGEGVAADPIEAHRWLLIAAQRGDALAQSNLAFSRDQLDLRQIKEATRRAALGWKK